MKKDEFKKIRSKIGKTQKQMSQLLGSSIKAVHSYEQGWRKIPPYVERQILFLLSRKIRKNKINKLKCWEIIKCNAILREKCPAWEFNSGDLCWFINGTTCHGKVHENWHEKLKMCKECEFFHLTFEEENEESQNG